MNLISNTFSHFWTTPQLNPKLAMISSFRIKKLFVLVEKLIEKS